jgi:retron-type reverse transcriptase
MKRLNNLWQQIISFDNLLKAYQKAQRGKSQKSSVAEFTLNLETELFSLQQQLSDGSYQPGGYRLFTIYEHKPRTIAAAPFRDRVVHHALMNIIEPPLDKKFIYDSYACRKKQRSPQSR